MSISFDWDEALVHGPLRRRDAEIERWEKDVERARAEILPWLSSERDFLSLLAWDDNEPLLRMAKEVAMDMLEDEGFSGPEEVRLSLLDDVNKCEGWFRSFLEEN